MKNWIPTEWTHKKQLKKSGHITIHRMTSPYYKGIRFAVRKRGLCLSIDGNWDYEPSPSDRDDAFYKKFRFESFEKACEMAEKEIKNEIHTTNNST